MSVMESGCLWGDGPGCCASLALGMSCGKSSNVNMKYKKKILGVCLYVAIPLVHVIFIFIYVVYMSAC